MSEMYSVRSFFHLVTRRVLTLGRFTSTQGIFTLKPGEALFSRDIAGSGKPEDDVIKCWVTGK